MIKVIIDGANVVSINGTRKRLAKRIENAIGHLDPLVDCVKAVLPSHFYSEKEKARFRDPDILDKFVQEGKVDLIDGDDDYAMVQYCTRHDAYLLTNDRLKKQRKEEWWSPEHELWAKTHLLTYTIIDDQLVTSQYSKQLLPNLASIPQASQRIDGAEVLI